MIVNTQKLLPPSKSSSLLVKVSGSKIIPSIKKKSINTQKLLGPRKDEPGQIVKVLTDIDVRLKLILKEDQSQQNKKRREKEKKEFEDQEKKLEAPKETKKFKFPSLSIPGSSFLDRIKRFLFFTALGWVFTKFQDQLPKLQGVIKIITQVYGVAENIFKFLLESFVNVIDRGYKAYDKVRDLAKSIGGEKAQKDFDNLSSKLNEYINYALIGGMALTGAINAFSNEVKGRKGKDGGTTAGVGGRPRTPGRTSTGYRLVQRGGSSKGLSGGRYGSSQVERIAKFDPLKKNIFQRAGQASRIGAKKATQAVIGKQATKQLLRLAKGPLSRLPLLGGLIEFGLSWALGDPVGKAAFRGVGTLLLGAVGSLILPGFGTFVGGWAGAELAGKLYEVLFENKKPQGKVQKKQGGGPVTRGGKTQGGPSRSIKITRRKPLKVKPKQSQPGKDVGGKKKIKELYPDPSARSDIEGEQKSAWWKLLPQLSNNPTPEEIQQRNDKIKALPNSYKALTGVAKILKDIPFGIGALMGGAVDVALGEKLPKNAIDNLSNGISYLINAISNRQLISSLSSIEKEITRMETGGAVPRLKDFNTQDQFGLGKDISKVLDGMIRQKVDEAIREVQKQLMPGKYSAVERGSPSVDPDRGGGGGGGGGGTGQGLNQPNVSGKSGYKGSTNVIDTGYRDANGRPIKLNPGAAQAFRNMISAGMPFRSGDVANVYRDEAEYLRLINAGYNPASNSAHNYGEGADIHGAMGEWIKRNGRRYGWYYIDYPGTHGGHFEWKGTPTRQPTQGQPPGRPPGQTPSGSVRQSGEASWYGPGFYGNRTASGDLFREGDTEYTAAHRTLPFGTKVTVTNKSNGKSIQVRINDRGPFKAGRIIDLNKAARDALGGQDLMNVDLSYKGGGYIPKQSPKDRTKSLTSYPSYSSEGGMMIAIQPMIIEKTIPVPSGRRSGGGAVMFPIAGVNNSNMQSLSRG
jgi:rare lipoprotein A